MKWEREQAVLGPYTFGEEPEALLRGDTWARAVQAEGGRWKGPVTCNVTNSSGAGAESATGKAVERKSRKKPILRAVLATPRTLVLILTEVGSL